MRILDRIIALGVSLGIVLSGCGRDPGASRLASGSDRSATFGISVDSDGNFGTNYRTELHIGFGFHDPRSRADTEARRERGQDSLFEGIRKLFDSEAAPRGEAALRDGKTLTFESDRSPSLGNADSRRAQRSGKSETRTDRFASFDAAAKSFDRQVQTAKAKLDTNSQDVAKAAALLERLVNAAAQGHNAHVVTVVASAEDILAAAAALPQDRFATRAGTYGGDKVRDLTRYADWAERHGTHANKAQLIELARAGIAAADAAYAAGDVAGGDFASELAWTFADLALSLTPVIGWLKDCYEGGTGYSWRGEKLDKFSRSMAILGIFTAGIGSKLGTAAKAGKIFGKIAGRNADEAAELAQKIIKSIGPEQAAKLNIKGIPYESLPRKDVFGVLKANVDAMDADLAEQTAGKVMVFYSGGLLNAEAASDWAEAARASRTTLEMTAAGDWLNGLNDSMKKMVKDGILADVDYRALWDTMSANYAKGARGVVHVFVDGHSPTSTFARVELPELERLRQAGLVSDIIFH